MNPLKLELERRALPPLRSRREMQDILQREVYGYLPDVACKLATESEQVDEARYMCGTVVRSHVMLRLTVGTQSHAFRVDRLLHTDGQKRPLILLNNFHPMEASPYFPVEELSEYDVDYLVFCNTDITSDDDDFTNGLARILLPNGQVEDTTCGKIGIWAWAAMRVLDYGLTLPGTDPDNVAIVGHSRLGKTAAYTAMMDERFKFAFSNAAGCAGDALAHGCSGLQRTPLDVRNTRLGELIRDITEKYGYWFCKNYRKYAERNGSDEFDQHYLLACIAPRYVMVGSCDLDAWADPVSQQLCALAASEAWEQAGLTGLVGSDHILDAGESLIDGHVGYFKIHAKHFLSRHSWRQFLRFVEKHRAD